MDPSMTIVILLNDDEDETLHSEEDVEMFQVPLNQEIVVDASNSQLTDSDADECLRGQTVPVFHQHTQTNAVQDPVFNNEAIKTNNPNCESQYAKLQQMSNQQASVNEQPSAQVNRSKQVPFSLLLPILIPQLSKDRAMQLQTLLNKLKRDEMPKEHFVQLLKGIVDDQMLRIALKKVQQQLTNPKTGSSGQKHHVRIPLSSSNAVIQETGRSSVHMRGLNKQQQQHIHFPSTYGSSGGNFNPFLGTITGSLSSLRPKDVGMFQDPLNRDIGGDASNSQLPDSDADNNAMIQDECLQGQTVTVYHQHTQTNSVQDPVFNHEPIKTNNPNCESQYAKLQQMSNQQATVNEQPSSQVNRSKQVPFGLLLPILIPQLPKDRAMQLQTLFNKLKRDEIPKDRFVQLLKGIVDEQMFRIALTKVQEQIKSNTGSSGQQHPVSMPTVTSIPPQFNDPHALVKLHPRSMNAAADHSHNTSSVMQVKTGPTYSTMDISTKKSPENDVRVVKPTQLLPSSSNTISQETENTPVHTQGFYNQQQQHIHFPSPYEISGGNFNPFLGTTTGSFSSLRPQPQPHNSHKRRIPHQSIGLNHLGVEQQSSFNDPKRMRGGSVSTVVNNTASQQTLNSWQPSAASHDLYTEQHHLSKLHGLPSVNSGQNEQGGGVNQGTVKDPAGEAEGEWEQQVPPPEQQANQQEPAAPEAMGQAALHQILDVFWEIRTDFGRLESRLGAVEARLKDLEKYVIQISRHVGYEST